MTAVRTEKAFAKVNLHLEICGRRDNGYHDILSVMSEVGLYDLLKLTEFKKSCKGDVSVTIDSDGGKFAEILNSIRPGANLIEKAVRMYLSDLEGGHFRILLEKNIPAGAGLGGGSADAAAMLRILNSLYGFYSVDELTALAAEIGSDVPFCLNGGVSICSGTGDSIRPAELKSGWGVLAANNGIHVDTAEAYRLADEAMSGGRYNGHIEPSKLAALIREGDFEKLFNDFENPVFRKHPEISGLKNMMLETNPAFTVMTGSGSTMIALYDSEVSALAAAGNLGQYIETVIVTSFKSGRYY